MSTAIQCRQSYVVGFVFDADMENVALIRKNKPAWQAGKLNGIGGKIEDGELPLDAMRREFSEEATYQGKVEWNHFCAMSGWNNDGSRFAVDFFFTRGDVHRLSSRESEQIEVVPCCHVVGGVEATVGNVPWLMALAIDFGKGIYPPSVVDVYYAPRQQNPV